jgi:hypothetical protein
MLKIALRAGLSENAFTSRSRAAAAPGVCPFPRAGGATDYKGAAPQR